MIERIPYMPEVWLVPANLADAECEHGRIGGCPDCDRRRAAEAVAAELVDRLHEVKETGMQNEVDPRTRWTEETVIAAIQEVGGQLGRTPSTTEMRDAGFGGVFQKTTTDRLGKSWAQLVELAGYEPRVRGQNDGIRHVVEPPPPEPAEPLPPAADEVEEMAQRAEADDVRRHADQLLDLAIGVIEARKELARAEDAFQAATARVWFA